ncbi:hypothetical protein [Schumannella soli]|uniref:Uncharacterized protein n=1 Tax=Schumannella soli TaxID=2590779 RepID=A0A506XYL0_9MICO|nr:hypothetical protein [Schumannella soli]TPW74693.1 hypothetical protein FJ657_14010 [Schumannella soli]
MSDVLFTFSGSPVAAIELVGRTIVGIGYSAQVQPDGRHRFSRGDANLTALAGANAAEMMYIEFHVVFGIDAQGAPTALIQRGSRSIFANSGTIGIARTDNAFRQLVDAVGHAASAAGIYRGFREE